MISDAVDTAVTLGWAFAIWIILLAIVATAALYTIAATLLATWRGLRRLAHRTPQPAWARNRLAARRIARTRTYEEAA